VSLRELDELLALRAENERLRRWLTTPLRGRLVELLFSLAVQRDGDVVVVRPPIQAELGKMTYSCREAVSRELQKLEQEGLILRRKRGNGETVGISLTDALRKELP
jgi:DNA-binding MarR family transcriptional regulator